MENYGLVSIITPTYNSESFIQDLIQAVTAQTYQNWELLITDDCSSDGTCQVIERFMAKDARIKLFRLEQNSGAGVARNNSIKQAQGRYIAFCDSDDRWLPNKLEQQLQFMQERNCALSYTSYLTCTESGEINGRVQCLKEISYPMIIRDNGIGCLTAVYDASKIGKFYMPTIRKRQDWCLWIKIIKVSGTAQGLQEDLAIYRLRANSISSNKVSMLKYNFAVYHEALGFSRVVSALLLFGYFLPYYFYKKLKQRVQSAKMKQTITPPYDALSTCGIGEYNQPIAA